MSNVTWRDPAFIQLVKSKTSNDQFSRFKKMYQDPFFVIHIDFRPLAFKVSGSMRDEYTVAIPLDGKPTCTCLDARIHCNKKSCVCKHVCFVLFRVLKMDLVSSTRNFFETRRLEEDEVREVYSSVMFGRLRHHDHSRADPVFTSGEIDRLVDQISTLSTRSTLSTTSTTTSRISLPSTSRDKNQDFLRVERIDDHDECPICYDELVHAEKELRGCPDCGKGVHLQCIRRWLYSAPRPSCVYCRSMVWASFDILV